MLSERKFGEDSVRAEGEARIRGALQSRDRRPETPQPGRSGCCVKPVRRPVTWQDSIEDFLLTLSEHCKQMTSTPSATCWQMKTVSLKSPLPPITLTGYKFKVVNLSLWAAAPKLPLQLGSGIRFIGKPETRPVSWSRLITSSGYLVDVVTPLDLALGLGTILLAEGATQSKSDQRDPEIDLARVESSALAHFGIQLVTYEEPFEVDGKRIRWTVMEAVWCRRMKLVARGVEQPHEDEIQARRCFKEEAHFLKTEPLVFTFTPTSREITADTGKWLALQDVHPKTVKAIDMAASAVNDQQAAPNLQRAAHEFGIEFYALRKQIAWPAKENVTKAIYPMNNGSAADRKSLGRRKPSKNVVQRFMATCWIAKGLADMPAAKLTKLLNDRFHTPMPLTVAQVRKMRQRLQLFVDWDGSK
jgi:hypothetical protein